MQIRVNVGKKNTKDLIGTIIKGKKVIAVSKTWRGFYGERFCYVTLE